MQHPVHVRQIRARSRKRLVGLLLIGWLLPIAAGSLTVAMAHPQQTEIADARCADKPQPSFREIVSKLWLQNVFANETNQPQQFASAVTGAPRTQELNVTETARPAQHNIGVIFSPAFTKKFQILVIIGLLLTVCLMFMPSLLPQNQARTTATTPTQEASRTQVSRQIASPQSAADAQIRTAVAPGSQGTIRPAQADSAPPRALEEAPQILPQEFPRPAPVTSRNARMFFEQSGLTVVERSPHYWELSAKDNRYEGYSVISALILDHVTLNEQWIKKIYPIIQRAERPASKTLVVIIGQELPLANSYHQINLYKIKRRVTMIPCNLRLIAKSLRSGTCAQTLEKLICLAEKPANLYETSLPVEDAFDFFGRDAILTTLVDSVNHLQQIGVFGLRKIGKTSLLWQLREQLSRQIVVYLDLQHLPRDCSYLYHLILQECRRDLAVKYPDLILPEWSPLADCARETQSVKFVQRLLALWECVKAARHDLKVVLLLDEVEYLLADHAGVHDGFAGFHEFMGVVRGISQQYGFLVSIVASSRSDIARLDRIQGQSNPGFQYYKEVFLTSLSEDGCNQMISSIGAQMGCTFTDEALSRIYYETGGHPYVTRQLCGLITRGCNRPTASPRAHPHGGTDEPEPPLTVQVQDIEDAISDYIESKRDYLESVWQQLAPIEQELLLLITTNNSCALEDLITNAQTSDVKRQRRKAISALIENELIEKCENKYSIRMGLFEQFLLANN